MSENYPYDQDRWNPRTQNYCCTMSKYGWMPDDPLFATIIEQGKCAYIEGTEKRIFEQEYEDYLNSL